MGVFTAVGDPGCCRGSGHCPGGRQAKAAPPAPTSGTRSHLLLSAPTCGSWSSFLHTQTRVPMCVHAWPHTCSHMCAHMQHSCPAQCRMCTVSVPLRTMVAGLGGRRVSRHPARSLHTSLSPEASHASPPQTIAKSRI